MRSTPISRNIALRTPAAEQLVATTKPIGRMIGADISFLVFGLSDDVGKGTAIWEPLGWRSGLFDREGNVTDLMRLYDELAAAYPGNSAR